jgi:outer membrane protein assembly factor BamB
MRAPILAGIVSLATVVGLEPTPARQLTHPQLPRTEALQKLGLKKRWHVYLPVEGPRDGVAVAQAIDNQCVVQTLSGSTVALDSETGRTQWRVRVDSAYSAHKSNVAYNGRMFFMTSNARMFGLARATGNAEWSYDLPGILATGAAADIDRIFLCTNEGRVFAYMLPLSQAEARGQVAAGYGGRGLERSVNPATLTRPEKLWEFQLDAAVLQPPLVFPTHVVFADGKGNLFSFQKDQRSLADIVKGNIVISAPMAQQGDMLYIASQDHNIYAYQMELGTLRLRWQYATGSKVLHKPALIGDEVYIFTDANGLHCLDRETGLRRWIQPEARAFAGASKRLLCTADRHGNLLVLDRQKGKPVGVLDTREFAMILANDATNRVFLANHDGLMICLQDLDPSEEAQVFYHVTPKPAAAPKPVEPAAEPPVKPKEGAKKVEKEEMKEKEK